VGHLSTAFRAKRSTAESAKAATPSRLRPPLPALTGLRFMAAGCVLVSHSTGLLLRFTDSRPDWHEYLRTLAGIGMPLFFVLSGFVIHYNYGIAIERDRYRGVANFFIARFARLYPLFLVCLLFDLAFKAGYNQLPPTTWRALPLYLTLTQSWFYIPMGEHQPIFQFGVMPQVSWSISTEWFFYCLYPFIWLGLRRLRSFRQITIATGGVIAISVAIVLALGLKAPLIEKAAEAAYGPIALTMPDAYFLWLVYFSPFIRVMEFILGCLIAAAYINLRDRPVSDQEHRWASIGLGISCGIIFYLQWFFYVKHHEFVLTNETISHADVIAAFSYCYGMAPFIGIIVFCCARYKNVMSNFLSIPNIVICGEASYSLYMLHMMVIYAYRYNVADMVTWQVGLANVLMWLLTLASAIGLSLITWQCIEVPARGWLRRARLVPRQAQSVQEA
jgi:peptidoglycan/LPS O-acetylase OafA/YrhL